MKILRLKNIEQKYFNLNELARALNLSFPSA